MSAITKLATTSTISTAALRRARWGVTLVFAADGVAVASLAVRTPSLKLEHALTDGRLGLVSAVTGIAAAICLQLAGRLAARLGSALIVRTATVLLPLALLGVGLSRGFAQLCAAMLLLGALIGILDVVMNAHAVAVEAALGRPVMNSCHAAWSLGAVAGSLIGGAAAQADVSLTSHYLGLSVVLVAVALVAGRWLLPSAADRTPRPVQDDSRPDGQLSRWAAGWRAGWRAGWTRRLLVLGAMGATILTCEAAVANWSGVLLHEHLGASLGVASLGYFVFTGCETAGRLVGDRLTARYCAAVLIRLGTAIAAGGLTLVVLSPTPALAVIGFAVMGLGLATPLPVLFSVVGHLGGASGPGAAVFVARFSTMTYSGILLGPALIGLVAGLIGLGWTLAALVPPLLGVALFGAAAAPDQLAATE